MELIAPISWCLLLVALLGAVVRGQDEVEPAQPVDETKSELDILGSYYLITFPNTFVAESTGKISIQLFEPDESIVIWVTLSIEGNITTENSVVVDDKAELSLQVPKPKGCSYQLTATVMVHLRRYSEVEWSVRDEKRVFIRCNNRDTFVQTDKAIYRPGQTVFFRILTLDQHFVPDHRPIDTIWVQAPNRVRVEQWDDQERKNNVLVDLSFPMTPDPVFGTWEIHVLFQGVKTIQRFEIEEYVLPRYEVTLEVSDVILISDEVLPVKVCAIYTYGKPVSGSVQVYVGIEPSRYTTASPFVNQSKSEVPTGIDGCANVELDLTQHRLQHRDSGFQLWRRLIVIANFEETASGTTQSLRSDPIRVTTSPFNLVWESGNNFKPGLPYHTKVQKPDGTPSRGVNVDISCSGTNFTYTTTVSSDASGYAIFEVPTPTGTLDSFSCRSDFPDYSSDPADADPNLYRIYPGAGGVYLRALYSESSSYLQFQPIFGDLRAGRYAILVLQFTYGAYDGDFPGIKFQFLSRGSVISADIEAQRDPETISSEDGDYYEQKFKLHVTASMSPEIRIVAFFIRGTEVVTATVEFSVKPRFENEVEIDFGSAEVKPGEETYLNIKSEPGSLCAVGVVDESVILLGGDNRLTTEKVFESLNKYKLPSHGSLNGLPSCIPNEEGAPDYDDYFGVPIPIPLEVQDAPIPIAVQEDPVEIQARRRRQLIDRRPGFFGSSFPQYPDGSKAFLDSGLIYISNLLVETSPCRRPYYGPFFRGAVAEFALAEEAFATADSLAAGDEQRVRTYFPETWLWKLYEVGSSGRARITVTAPDTITDWVGSGFCLHAERGIGLSDDVSLRAFQPFFIDPNLPYSIIRGEAFPVGLSVFNYLSNCLAVEVTIAASSDFVLLDLNHQRVCVCNDPSPVSFYIRPEVLGQMPIQFEAVSVADDDDICGGRAERERLGTSDALRRDLLNEAEGVEEERSYNVYFCPRDHPQETFLDHVALLVPDNYVPDSARGKVAIIGDILGPTLSNLANLLRIPSGCGEQNLIGLVPNIYALLYFTSTDQDNTAVQNKARSNILIGYQRELKFRLRDGSYSAFGESDGDGSAWLTAFVVRSFAQARQFVRIDSTDLKVSVEWLRSLQDGTTGCFRASGRVIHKSMQGGVNDEFTRTAYILLAITEAGLSTRVDTVVKAVECLEAEIENINDNYAIAIVTYALIKANSLRAGEMFTKLENAANREEGLVHWESNRPDIPSYGHYHRYHKPAIQVEITAYALLCYLSYFELSDAVSNSLPVITWLVAQQNPRGGFSSTQDTVVGLQALAEYAILIYGGGLDIEFSFVASPPCEVWELRVTEENKLVQQEIILPEVPTFLQMAATGTGCAIVQVSWEYNVFPQFRNDAPFTLNYTISRFEGDESKFHMTICASYTGDDEHSNMVLLENKPQSGFAPIAESLQGLKTKNLKRIEVEKRTITIYFQELTKSGDCVSYDLQRVVIVRDVKEGVLTVLDYYEKDLVSSELYYIEKPEELEERGGEKQGCPICSDEVPASFDDIYCDSDFVHKAVVVKENTLELYSDDDIDGDNDVLESKSNKLPLLWRVKLPEGCSCPLLQEQDRRVLVMNDGPDLNNWEGDKLSTLTLGARSAVLACNAASLKAAQKASYKC